jgi:hypothetical protein
VSDDDDYTIDFYFSFANLVIIYSNGVCKFVDLNLSRQCFKYATAVLVQTG